MKLNPLIKMLVEKATGVEDMERSLFIQAVRAIDRVSPQRAADLALRRFARPRRWPEPEVESALASKGTLVEFRCGLIAHKYGSGKTVLLVHGWGGRGLQLGSLIEPIVKQGFSVLALDGPAHGRSPGDWTSPTHFAGFLKSVSLELGSLHAIIAHSFGAVTTILALDNGVDADRAVLISGANRYGDILKTYSEILGLSPEASHLFTQAVSYRVGVAAKELMVADYFARVKQPALIIHDRNDKELKFTESEALAKANPKARLVITEGLGHRRILKSDILVQKVTEFLA